MVLAGQTPLLLLTFNCAKRFHPGEEVASFLEDAGVFHSFGSESNGPELIVIGLQEIAPIMDGCFKDVDNYVSSIIEGIDTALERSFGSRNNYTKLPPVISGAIALAVYVRNTETVTVTKSSAASIGCGYFRSTLKGGVGLRITLNDTREFTFVTAHLTANEGYATARNQDYINIATELDFGDGYGIYKPQSHLFFLGDLNYRSLKDPFARDPNVNEASHELLSNYQSIDELTINKEKGFTLFGMDEARIDFKPTYKFRVRSLDTYNRERIASWCDRILYLHYPSSVKIHKYDAIFGSKNSDHKPVYLAVSVPNSAPPFPLDANGTFNSTDGPKVNLSLSSKQYYDVIEGRVADTAIGWSIYLSSTKTGRLYAGFSFAALILIYYIWGLF